MILILPGKLRSEFLYSRLLSACSGEGSAGYRVRVEKNRRKAKENRAIFSKNGEEIRILLSGKLQNGRKIHPEAL